MVLVGIISPAYNYEKSYSIYAGRSGGGVGYYLYENSEYDPWMNKICDWWDEILRMEVVTTWLCQYE